ncbi:MAG: hypothetical protein CMJ19_21900 [Phycisphaeraceae bacterium]|nr:hypothetical protein [Phycisphaeraceae bacterium]
MHCNAYVGTQNQTVANLVIHRARRFGIKPDEFDDLQQKIVPKLACFLYKPERSNGANLNTALTSAIDKQLLCYLRACKRYQQRIERLRNLHYIKMTQPDSVPQTQIADMRMDIESVLAQLSERDRNICIGLSHGHTIKDIAKQVGCGRDTVSRAIQRMRKTFTDAGLKVWVDPDFDAEHAKSPENQEESYV